MPAAAGGVEGWLLPLHGLRYHGGTSASLSYADGATGRLIADFGDCIDAFFGSTTKPPTGLANVSARVGRWR